LVGWEGPAGQELEGHPQGPQLPQVVGAMSQGLEQVKLLRGTETRNRDVGPSARGAWVPKAGPIGVGRDGRGGDSVKGRPDRSGDDATWLGRRLGGEVMIAQVKSLEGQPFGPPGGVCRGKARVGHQARNEDTLAEGNRELSHGRLHTPLQIETLKRNAGERREEGNCFGNHRAFVEVMNNLIQAFVAEGTGVEGGRLGRRHPGKGVAPAGLCKYRVVEKGDEVVVHKGGYARGDERVVGGERGDSLRGALLAPKLLVDA
jgi:hypothetical protein